MIRSNGEANGNAKLTEAQVREIRSDPRGSFAVARQYNVTPVTIWSIRTFRTWKHID